MLHPSLFFSKSFFNSKFDCNSHLEMTCLSSPPGELLIYQEGSTLDQKSTQESQDQNLQCLLEPGHRRWCWGFCLVLFVCVFLKLTVGTWEAGWCWKAVLIDSGLLSICRGGSLWNKAAPTARSTICGQVSMDFWNNSSDSIPVVYEWQHKGH